MIGGSPMRQRTLPGRLPSKPKTIVFMKQTSDRTHGIAVISILTAVTAFLTGCAALNPSKVPGNPEGDVPYVETSQVLTAIKIQLARELQKVD